MLKSDTIDDVKKSWLDRPLLVAINLDWEKALYGLLIALAILTRLWDLGARVMSHDETVHIQWSWYLFKGNGYSHTPLSHGPFLFHVTALSYYLFGDSDFSARLAVALMGVALVALPYLLRRWLGRSGALVTSFLFLISPSLLYYSRYIRHDIPIIVWSLIAIAVIFRYLENRDGRWLTILAAAMSLMFATKEVSFIYIAIAGLFLVLLFLVRLGAPRWHSPTWAQWGDVLLWIALATLLLSALAFGVAGIVDRPPEQETESAAAPSLDEGLEPKPAQDETASSASDFARRIATWTAAGTLAVLAGYMGLLTLGSPSHQRPILTVLGLAGVIVLGAGLILISLNMVELFPFQYRDCEQAPVADPLTDQMQCSEANCELIKERCQQKIPVITGKAVAEFDQDGTRIAVWLTNFEIVIAVVLIAIITILAGVSAYAVLNYLMPFQSPEPIKEQWGKWPALDLILFIGSFTLPSLSALAINQLPRLASKSLFGIDAAFNALDYSEAGLLRSAGFVFVFLAISVAVGLWWDWRRWLTSAVVFYVIFIVLFTTVFTNGVGLASGTVGSLGYWLEQQGVQRGSQPPYYYGLWVPLYEYLPLIGTFAAALYLLVRGHKIKNTLTFPFFLIFWTALTWVAYSYAGEKMPWLTVHFAVPMALATGWVVGKLIEGADWRAILRRGGWAVFVIGPAGLAALWQVISPWLSASGNRPFSGYNLNQLNSTLQFTSALLVLAATVGVLYWVGRRTSLSAVGRTLAALALGILALLTIRTAWTFTYLNYDLASEFLVYAHASPDVREVMGQIKDISQRTAGDLSLDISYTADGSYPFIWYLRHYPNASQLPNPPSRPDLDKPVIVAGDAEWSGIEPYLGANYVCNQYNFLWWPMQDYYGLSWERVRYATTNPEMRAAVWDIVFRRDYEKYEQATDKTVRLSEWPLRDGFRFCVRRDVLAQVWSESAGPTDPARDVDGQGPEMPDYGGLELPVAAELLVSTLGGVGDMPGGVGDWNGPRDIATDTAGFVYVADSNNHRIVKLDSDGQLADTWDSTWWHNLPNWQPGCVDEAGRPLAMGDGEFCEPWGVAVGPDDRVYIADTWNHRVQIFTPEGEFLGKFGTFGQSGSSPTSAPAQFYGPRDVVVDENGYIYVSDTGNKRVQVFDSNWQHVRSFGGPGIIEGRLEEPVGVAIGPDNLLYVADTWNLRIQVFALDGEFEREWPIQGWSSQSTANKPYVATDSAGRVYVTDPEGLRVLVFDEQGTPLAVLGGPGSTLFQLSTGVTLDAQDRVWVSDAGAHRLLRFGPLVFP